MANLNKESIEKKVKNAKYLNWLVNFTERIPDKIWDDETVNIKLPSMSELDIENSMMLSTFIYYIEELANEQFVKSIAKKHDAMRYQFKLRDNFYEAAIAKRGEFSVIRRIPAPTGDYVCVDEKIDQSLKKEREVIQYILLNSDLKIDPSVIGVHIAHACTLATLKENDNQNFKLWFGEKKQKIIILNSKERDMEAIEDKFYGIRDTGHNNVPKNSLIALSLGFMPKRDAMKYIENCTLYKGIENGDNKV